MLEDKVAALVEEALELHPNLFLIELEVSSNNRILVVLDGDTGVSVSDCVAISRAIEHNLDREEQDFSIEVTSAGATSPLVNPRQYVKNKGRFLEVKTKEGQTYEGKLEEADLQEIILRWKAREPKPIGKGKHTVQKEQRVAIQEIEQAKVIIKF
ncbi:MAG: ribosome assembly cofactor RimP [Flavobacteriaceae bacterium]|nr:ribosome assembly cofactor RimP [Flavobacteriaceae bacterium]